MAAAARRRRGVDGSLHPDETQELGTAKHNPHNSEVKSKARRANCETNHAPCIGRRTSAQALLQAAVGRPATHAAASSSQQAADTCACCRTRNR